MTYQNPIISGYNPDPSICRVGENFYLVTSTFEFFPGVPIYHSKNLVNWELINYCLTDKEQLPLEGCRPSGGIFAPTIRHHDGIFYMTTTNVTGGGNFIVHTSDIYGKWSSPAWVDQGGIDPSLLFDSDGKVYFCSTAENLPDGRQGIALCEVDPLTGERLTPSKIISYGTGGKAPHLYQIDGRYYLMLAEGGTEYGHMVTIFRGDSPWGPFESCPHNPILTHRNTHRSPIQATGHADIVMDQHGNWWMVSLGIRPTGPMLHHLGRETFLAPMRWVDGWPVVGEQGDGLMQITTEASLPAPARPVRTGFFTDFAEETLPLPFNWVRNPEMERYVLREKEGCFTIKGGEKGLSGGFHSPAFVGIRQKAFDTVTTVKLTAGLKEGGRAGLAVYYNDTHHYEIYLTRAGENWRVELNKRLYDMELVAASAPVPKGEIELRILSDRLQYQFFYRTDDGDFQLLGAAMTAGLATEATESMTFTGTYLGMFAQNGEGHFDSFGCKW